MEIKRKLFYIGVVDLLFILIPTFINITFATPDDFIFTLILSGDYTGIPSPFIIYSNCIYGIIISYLYTLAPSIEWYSVVNYLLSIISFNFILYVILSSKQKKITINTTIVALFLVQLYILLTPNFTVTAFELSLASSLVIIKKNNLKSYCASYILFILAALIRYNAAFIPYMIMLPLFIIPIKLKEKSYIIKFSFLSSLLISACILIFINHKIYHSDTSWANYIKYNSLRGKINDNPSIKEGIIPLNNPILKDEYELMSEHWISDGNIFSVEELQTIVDFLQDYKIANIKVNLLLLWNQNKYLLLAFMFLFTSVFLQTWRRRNSQLIVLLSSFCLFIIALVYTFSISILKERVIISVFGALAVVLAFLINKKSSSSLLYLSLFIIIVLSGVRIYNRNIINSLNIEKTTQVEKLVSQCKYNKIVFHNGVPISPDIFNLSQTNIAKKLVRIGWPNNCPYTEQYFNGFISYTQGVPFIANKTNVGEELRLIIDILNKYYNKTVEPVIISEDSNYVIVTLNEKK